MNLGKFLSALVDDITGKDANGRNADEKRNYMVTMLWLLAGLTVIAAVTIPVVAIIPGAIFLWKLKIHLTNTY